MSSAGLYLVLGVFDPHHEKNLCLVRSASGYIWSDQSLHEQCNIRTNIEDSDYAARIWQDVLRFCRLYMVLGIFNMTCLR